MGLDMYAYSIAKEIAEETPANDLLHSESTEIHYWRKHPNLHGWMHQLYLAKGGDPEDSFNGVPVPLSIIDIVKLKLTISAGILPNTTGFFFGSSSGEEIADDIKFCDDAAKELSNGNVVYYTSSW